MSERSDKARRALHGLRAYAATLDWERDRRQMEMLTEQITALMDEIAARPGNTREAIVIQAARSPSQANLPRMEYTREDKIREELANDPHCYD